MLRVEGLGLRVEDRVEGGGFGFYGIVKVVGSRVYG